MVLSIKRLLSLRNLNFLAQHFGILKFVLWICIFILRLFPTATIFFSLHSYFTHAVLVIYFPNSQTTLFLRKKPWTAKNLPNLLAAVALQDKRRSGSQKNSRSRLWWSREDADWQRNRQQEIITSSFSTLWSFSPGCSSRWFSSFSILLTGFISLELWIKNVEVSFGALKSVSLPLLLRFLNVKVTKQPKHFIRFVLSTNELVRSTSVCSCHGEFPDRAIFKFLQGSIRPFKRISTIA